MAALRIVATFSGDPVTAFHEGIPARDLTERDWERLTPEQQETVAASKVYDLKPKETKALAEQADQPPPDVEAPADVGEAPVTDALPVVIDMGQQADMPAVLSTRRRGE